MDINLNNTSLTSSGNLRFSGISSGIDTQALINSIIESKRIVATQVEDKIAVNNEKVAAFEELKSLSATFASSMNELRGSTSVLDDNIFKSKVSFTDSRATASAPVGHVASDAGAILGASVTDEAATGSHTIEVLQIAKAHQLRSDAVSSKNTNLSSLGFTTGNFDINGHTITVGASDSLLDLRDKINATNTGATPSNVNASIVSVSGTEHYLVVTSSETGTDNTITFDVAGQAVHNSLGLTDAGTTNIKNELQTAQNAILNVDNLGVNVERQSNTISDVIEGVTLDIFKAEANTEIVLDVEADLTSVKESILSFMDAYNALKDFIVDQKTELPREEGGDPEFGVLFGNSTLRTIESKLSEIISTQVAGVEDGYASLGQVGIEIDQSFRLSMDDETFDQKLLENLSGMRKLFSFDFSASDSRVSVISVGSQATYTVDGSNIPEPYYLNIAGTDVNGDVLSANIQTTDTIGNGGFSDGSVTDNGKVLTVESLSDAEGLKLFFNGDPSLGPIDDIEVSYTRGVADQLYHFFDNISKSGGILDEAVEGVNDEIAQQQERVEQIDYRLELERNTLNAKFLAMEQAMYQLNTLREQISRSVEAMNQDS